MSLTNKQLGRLAYPDREKCWTNIRVYMRGKLHDEIRRLAEADNRPLGRQMRWLLEIAVQVERRRLAAEGILESGNTEAHHESGSV